MNQGYYNNGNYNNGYNNNYNGNYNRPYYPNYNYNNQVVNPNTVNYGNMNNGNNNNNKNNDKTSLLPLVIVIGILCIVVILLIVVLLYPSKNEENVEKVSNNTTTETTKPATEDKSDITIGNSKFGKMKIPYNYIKDSSSTDTLLKYYSKDKKYSVKMMLIEDDKTAYTYAKAYVDRLKSSGATDVKQAQITLLGEEAQQIYAVTEEDNTVFGICVKHDNSIRFIVIEGPDGTNIVFKALETYTW